MTMTGSSTRPSRNGPQIDGTRPTARVGGSIGALLLLCAMSILGLGLYHEHEVRRAELASAVHEARNLAKSLVQHIEDTVDLANSALLGIAYRLETDGSSPQTLERLQGFLHLRKRSLPWVRGLFVYGPDGAWLATTEPVRLADYNNADRSYFQYHQSNADPSAHVGKPVRSRSSGVWIITISRRITMPDGSFGGVVAATVDVEYFSQNFGRFDIGAGGSITLLSADTTLLARFPSSEDRLGSPTRATPITQAMASAPHGSVQYTSTIDGVGRVAAFQKGDRYPLYVLVARSTDNVLEQWRSDAVQRLTIVASLTVVVLALCGLVVRQIRARQKTMDALAASEAEFRLLAESSSDMVTRVDAEGRMTYISPAARRVVGWEPSELLGGSIYNGVNEGDVEAVRQVVDSVMSGRTSECLVRYRNRHREQGEVWFETAVSASRDQRTGKIDGMVGITRNISQQKLLEDQLTRQASTDGLTGLGNRRLFDDRIRREFALAKQALKPLSHLLIDVDHFKAFNDNHGHQAGDDCLRAVAAAIQDQVTRPADLAVRYGGEEFAVILPETDREGALAVAIRIHQAIAGLEIPHKASPVGPLVSVSIGGATLADAEAYRVPSDMIGTADVQLYAAKAAGRNRTLFAEPKDRLDGIAVLQFAESP